MLRRVLPMWKPEEAIAEAIAYCKKNHVDEVAWFDESSGVYHELLTLRLVRQRAKWLKIAGQRLRRAGIKNSINVITTIGHGDYGGDGHKIHPGMELMVDYTGAQSKMCACVLSPVWQNLIKQTYRLYAAAKPERIWADDDFRHTNHGPVSFGCYCKRHLAGFSRRIGTPVTREQLVAAILKPGTPHPWRAPWFDFLEETLVNAANMIQSAVKEVSPRTQVGWMSTTPFSHELEGRGARRQLEAFAGKDSAAIRMCTTQYFEGNPRLMLIEDEALKKMIPQLPEGTTACTEIESMPHSIFVKSANWLAAQIEWACALNVTNQTLNLYDFLGTPMAKDPEIGEMLRGRKAEFNSVAGMFGGCDKFRGIGMLSNPYSARAVHTTTGKDMLELMVKETGWADVLRAFGMPIVCDHEAEVMAVTGQALRTLNQEELKRVFSRGVLLDVSALKTLEDMGYGRWAGVCLKDEIRQKSRWIGPEELTDKQFGGGKHRFTWTYAVSDSGKIGVLELQKGARMISRIVDPDLKFLFPGLALYENELGGRVAVAPYDFMGKNPDAYVKGTTSFFYSAYRREQMQAVMRWLGRGKIPMLVQATGWVLPHRADGEKTVMLAAMNVNYDDWQGLTMRCAVEGDVHEVQWMDKDGKWRQLDRKCWRQTGTEICLEIRAVVPPLRMTAALLKLQ